MDNVWRPTAEAFRRGDLEGGVRLFIDGTSGSGAFDHLPAPALGIIMDELGRCLPASELSVIPGTSHNMHTGNPQAFNEAVLGFLDRNA
jgi:pimeloyl-ACP methyl ester carboxylesterase